jgi:hypothetical protein
MCPQLADLPAIVNKKIEALSKMSFDQLAALPRVSEEEIRIDGKQYALCTWHDPLEHDEQRVVVQVFQRGVLSVKVKHLEGFAVNAKNEKRPLSSVDLAVFD